MNITEKDLFLFIKYPDQLENDKKLFLERNAILYENEIAYIKSIKGIKFENTAPFDKDFNVILQKSSVAAEPGTSTYRLAAATTMNDVSEYCTTYSDANEEIFVKVFNSLKGKNLFVLSENKMKNVRLTLLPSNDEYKLNPSNSIHNIPGNTLISQIKVTYKKF